MRQPSYKRIYAEAPAAAEKAAFAEVEWSDLMKHLTDAGLKTDQRCRTADRLVRDRVEYEFLYPIVAVDGPVVDGPNGGEMFSYRWSALRKLEASILKMEESLKILPREAVEERKPDAPKTKADSYLTRASRSN